MSGPDEDLLFAGSTRASEALAAGDVSSTELTEAYLRRIESLDPEINSYRVVTAERALDQAADADRLRSSGGRGPLLGVPIALKDTIDVAGQVTGRGSRAFDAPAQRDAELVRRLRESGAVFLGKTNLPELAICGFTESEANGITRNPWNPAHTPGGSSGGSAAAMAAGLASIAHASDGAGSIRIPAACCGLFGLKPQRDRVPMAPDSGHWLGMSVNGCLSRTVMDTACFLDAVTADGPSEALSPTSPRDYFAKAAARPPGNLRIAFSSRPVRALAPPMLSDEVESALAEAAGLMAGLGHEVAWEQPDYGSVGTRISVRYLAGIAEEVATVEQSERLEARTRGFARLGSAVPRSMVDGAVRGAEEDSARILRLLERNDVLVTPTLGSLPVRVGEWEGKGALATVLGMSRRYPFTPLWNHLGNPAASVPMGLDAETGLPLSVQLIGRPDDEATLLSLAAQIEAERPWAQARPPLGAPV